MEKKQKKKKKGGREFIPFAFKNGKSPLLKQ